MSNHAPPDAERPATAATVNGSQNSIGCGGSIWTRDNNDRRRPQLDCEFCGKQFAKTSKRPARCCSRQCRDGLHRERGRLNGFRVSQVGMRCCALKSATTSIACKPTSRDPHPSQFSVPLDLLGRGYRWPGAPKLDRETREKIAWREIGRRP